MVEVRAAAASTSLDASAHQVEDLVELHAGQLRVGGGAADDFEQPIGGPRLSCHLGHHLLRRDVQREPRRHNGIKPAAAYRDQQRGAFHQFVTGQRKQPPLRGAQSAVVRTADAL